MKRNPWKDLVGCEVNLCQAAHCNPARLHACALRKAWLERRAELESSLKDCRGQALRDELLKLLEKLNG